MDEKTIKENLVLAKKRNPLKLLDKSLGNKAPFNFRHDLHIFYNSKRDASFCEGIDFNIFHIKNIPTS